MAGRDAGDGGGPCCGPPRCRPPWTRRSRRVPWRLAPAPREADGRQPCPGLPGDHRESLRRSRCYAAVVAPRPARLPGHSGPTGVGSGRQLVAALGTAGRKDGTPGPGAHAQPEAVGLGTPAVVRLVSALAHVKTPSSYYIQGASKLQDATLAERGGATARPYAGPSRRSTIARPTRRLSGSSPLAVSSVCARCEAFPAPGRLPARPRVDADATSLLACPFAGHQGCSHTTTNRAKPDKRVDRSPR